MSNLYEKIMLSESKNEAVTRLRDYLLKTDDYVIGECPDGKTMIGWKLKGSLALAAVEGNNKTIKSFLEQNGFPIGGTVRLLNTNGVPRLFWTGP